MWRVGLVKSCTRLFSALPQAVGSLTRLRKGKSSTEALKSALHNTVQLFLKPDAQLSSFASQQACIMLLKEMKEMRHREQVASLLQAFASSEPDVKFWAEAYNTTRQMLAPAGDFFLLAEQKLLEALEKSEGCELVYEALQTYSGLGCAKIPLSRVQKQLAEVIDAKLVRVPERWSKPSLFSLVLHTAAKISYASENLRSLLCTQLPTVLGQLETTGTYNSLGVVCSSACRLRLAKHHLEASVMQTVMRLQDKLHLKHVVNIAFYLSEKSYYNREFFLQVMPALEKAVEREGVEHFVVMLNATKAKLSVMEAQLPS